MSTATARYMLKGPRGAGAQDAIKDAIFRLCLDTTHWDEEKGLLRFSLRFEVSGDTSAVKQFDSWFNELRRLNGSNQ